MNTLLITMSGLIISGVSIILLAQAVNRTLGIGKIPEVYWASKVATLFTAIVISLVVGVVYLLVSINY